jgi:hypothetical protein
MRNRPRDMMRRKCLQAVGNIDNAIEKLAIVAQVVGPRKEEVEQACEVVTAMLVEAQELIKKIRESF